MTAKEPQPMPEKYIREGYNINPSRENFARPKAPSSPPPPPEWARKR